MARRRSIHSALGLDAQQTDRRIRGGQPREILVVGDLPVAMRSELGERGGVLLDAPNLHEAFEALLTSDFHAVVVDPRVDKCGSDFVDAVKESAEGHERTIATLYGARGSARFLLGVQPPSQEELEAIRLRHRTTPFIVLPSPFESNYSIEVTRPESVFIRDSRLFPIVTAILSADAASLLALSGPMA